MIGCLSSRHYCDSRGLLCARAKLRAFKPNALQPQALAVGTQLTFPNWRPLAEPGLPTLVGWNAIRHYNQEMWSAFGPFAIAAPKRQGNAGTPGSRGRAMAN